MWAPPVPCEQGEEHDSCYCALESVYLRMRPYHNWQDLTTDDYAVPHEVEIKTEQTCS